ncbi:uncharacterized protein LOC144470030 [Augochlora pura]
MISNINYGKADTRIESGPITEPIENGKNNDYGINMGAGIKTISDTAKKFEDKQLEALLNEDPSQTQEELAASLGVTQQAVSVRLKFMGMVHKQGNWVPYGNWWDILPHLPYSPDIAPSDYWLFRQMQNDLAGHRFTSFAEIENWLVTWIATKDEIFFRDGIRKLPERWGKAVNSDGQYFD